MKKKNIALLNTITSLILQVLTLINGFIIPRIILVYFGSEVNGLVSSLTKFLSYIALLEGGVTGVVMANLYKPLTDKDENKLSSVINTTRRFYKKIAYIFLIYSLLLALLYPVIFKTHFSYSYVLWLTLILSITSFIQYCFSLTAKTLLNADKKVYIVSITQSIILIANIILSIVAISIYPSVHILKLLSAIIFLAQPIIFNYFVNKNYTLDQNAKDDPNLLKSRWDGFSVLIAGFIHTNTDVLLLTIFTNLNTVSVYSIYALVGSGLRTILSFLSNGIKPSIGQLYAKDKYEELNKRFDIYEYLNFFLVFLFFSVACLLIVPFVMIYTKNITDADYYQPIFGIIIMLAEGFYLIKNPHVDLAYAANKFKEIKIPCYIEAGINIIVSLILIKPLGLIGIAIGTLAAMIYRMIFHIWYTNKALIKRRPITFIKKLLSFGFFTTVGIIICKSLIPNVNYNLLNWLWHGMVYLIIFGILYLINSLLFYKDELKSIKEYLE